MLSRSSQARAVLAALTLLALVALFHLGDRLMKRARILTACLAVLVLAGCAERTHTAPGGSVPAVVTSDPALSALVAAEGAFNAAANAELDAKATGLLVGEKAARADDVRHRAYSALLAMRTAYRMGQAFDPAQLLTLTNQLLVASGTIPPPPSAAK